MNKKLNDHDDHDNEFKLEKKKSRVIQSNLFYFIFLLNIFYFLTGQVRALCNYTGNPNPGGGRPALRFQKDDVIKLLNNDAQWWKVRKYSLKITQANNYLK